MRKDYLVFTDLDGTLLDHHDYSHLLAKPALADLDSLEIPVILNSSKTLQEMEWIAQDLSLTSPRIAENGSLIVYPATGKKHIFGADYTHICKTLQVLREQQDYQFIGFNDWTAEQIAEDTGLSVEASSRAAARESSEPIKWLDSDTQLESFRQKLAEVGLMLNRGGRYWHVMWKADKAQAMEYLIESYTINNQRPTVIALGDGPNDKNMLASADIAVIVHNPDGTEIDLPFKQGQQVIRTTLAGPSGWNDAIQQIINA